MAIETFAAEAPCSDVSETHRRARALAELLAPGDVLCLYGELGAGKTCFTKGLLAGLGGDPDDVTSPTFVLMQSYTAGRLPIYHFDAYRLHDGSEMLEIGSDETLSGDGVSVIEWADRVPEALPADRIEVHLRATGLTHRLLRMVGCGARPAACVRQLAARGLLAADSDRNSA